MKIVVDCNVVVSAGITDGVCAHVIRDVFLYHELILSLPIVEEYEIVCQRPRFAKYKKRMTGLIGSIKLAGCYVEPEIISLPAPDPDDLVYLQTAIAARAQLIVTGNTEDFSKTGHGGANHHTPRVLVVVEE